MHRELVGAPAAFFTPGNRCDAGQCREALPAIANIALVWWAAVSLSHHQA